MAYDHQKNLAERIKELRYEEQEGMGRWLVQYFEGQLEENMTRAERFNPRDPHKWAEALQTWADCYLDSVHEQSKQ